MQQQEIQPPEPIKREDILLIASRAKYDTVAELLQNADKIQEWLCKK